MFWLTGILGLALVVAPFLLNYTNNPTAMWASFAIGAVLVVDSVMEGFDHDKSKWEYWVIGIAGFAAILAPVVLGFLGSTVAVWTMVAVGLLAIGVAGSKVIPWRS